MLMILPPGHSRAQTQPVQRRLTRRERRMIAGVLATVAALTIAVVVALAIGNHTTGNGCIEVGLPYSTGGAELYRCGAAARRVCAGVDTPGGYTGGPGRAVAIQCRLARLPVG